jgi:hypothetical protein
MPALKAKETHLHILLGLQLKAFNLLTTKIAHPRFISHKECRVPNPLDLKNQTITRGGLVQGLGGGKLWFRRWGGAAVAY